jgi:hypothetical protein
MVSHVFSMEKLTVTEKDVTIKISAFLSSKDKHVDHQKIVIYTTKNGLKLRLGIEP